MCGLRTTLFLLLTTLVGSAACLRRHKLRPPDPEDLRALASVVEVRLKEWLVAWRAVQPGLRAEQFKKVDTRTIWEGAKLSPSDPLRVLNVVSPDGRWVVDPFAGVTLMKVDSQFEISAGPDTYVKLIDRRASTQRLILVCGTSCGFHEAVWLFNERFLV